MFSTSRGQQTLNSIFQKLLRQYIYCCSEVPGANIRKNSMSSSALLEKFSFSCLTCSKSTPSPSPHLTQTVWFCFPWVSANPKSRKATGKSSAVEMKAIKYKAAETAWRFYNGGHFRNNYLLYKALSANALRKKINPILSSGRAHLAEITSDLLRGRDAQSNLALWMAVEE